MSWFRKNSDATEHTYAQERLSAYLDGELSSPERGRVERHVGACRHCRWELDTLRRMIQWTRELPTVPAPRVFTLPVAAPARRARVGQRVWSLPVLQGATALVAVLFLLAVVGEAFLPGMLPASAPTGAYEREAAVLAEATQVVELVQESVMTAEVEAQTAPPPAAIEPEVQSLAAKAQEDEAAAAATAAPAGMGGGIRCASEQETQTAEAVTQTAEAVTPPPGPLVGIAASAGLTATVTPTPTATPEPSPTPTATATTTEEPSPTALPLPTATLVPTLALAPTLVAAVEAPSESFLMAPAPEPAEREQKPGLGWLVIAEIVLGVAFVALGTLTVILTVRRLTKT